MAQTACKGNMFTSISPKDLSTFHVQLPLWPVQREETGQRGLQLGLSVSRMADPGESETAGDGPLPYHIHSPTPPPPCAAQSATNNTPISQGPS